MWALGKCQVTLPAPPPSSLPRGGMTSPRRAGAPWNGRMVFCSLSRVFAFFYSLSLSHRWECRPLYLIFNFCSVAKNFLNKQGRKRRKNMTQSCRRLPLHFLPPDGLCTLSHQFSWSLVVTHLLRSHRGNSRHFAIRRIQTHLANQSDTLAEHSAP